MYAIRSYYARLLGTQVALPDPLPFTGGALGLFGYDLGRRFEILPEQAVADLKLPDMAVGIYDWAWVIDRHDGLAHLVVRGDEAALARRLTWWQELPEPAKEQDFVLSGPWEANMTAEGYRRITSYNVCYTKLLRARRYYPWSSHSVRVNG